MVVVTPVSTVGGIVVVTVSIYSSGVPDLSVDGLSVVTNQQAGHTRQMTRTSAGTRHSGRTNSVVMAGIVVGENGVDNARKVIKYVMERQTMGGKQDETERRVTD